MIAALKAEFRKLLSVRSTYILAGVSFLIGAVLLGFWVYGYQDVGTAVKSSSALRESMLTSLGIAGTILSIVVILLVGHEYRYNTIMYSLTSSNSRARVFFAKYIAGLSLVLIATAFIMLANYALFYVGAMLKGTDIVAQNVPIVSLLVRSTVVVLGYTTFAFAAAMLIRSLIGAISVTLLLASTVEGLLSILLKENTKYLPYTSLNNLSTVGGSVSVRLSIVVALSYVVVLGAIALAMFIRRDAN